MKKKEIIDFGLINGLTIYWNNINNDRLAEDVVIIMCESLNNFKAQASRKTISYKELDTVAANLNYYMEIISESGAVEQFDVKLDKRNNKRKQLECGLVNLEVTYKQKNCLNVTSLKMEADFLKSK